MRHTLLALFLIILTSCNTSLEWDGKWIITKITYNDKEVYPKTITDKYRITINIDGYENLERIKFNTQDSTIVFPGFYSDEIITDFAISNGQLKSYIKNSNQIPDSLDRETKSIFIQDYEIINLEHKYKVGLRSQKTKMIIIKESYLLDQQISNRMYNF